MCLAFCDGRISRSTVNCGSLVASRFTLLSQQSIKCCFSNNGVEFEVTCIACKRISRKRQVGKLNPALLSEANATCVIPQEFFWRLNLWVLVFSLPLEGRTPSFLGVFYFYNFIKLFSDRAYFIQHA